MSDNPPNPLSYPDDNTAGRLFFGVYAVLLLVLVAILNLTFYRIQQVIHWNTHARTHTHTRIHPPLPSIIRCVINCISLCVHQNHSLASRCVARGFWGRLYVMSVCLVFCSFFGYSIILLRRYSGHHCLIRLSSEDRTTTTKWLASSRESVLCF